MVEEDENQGLKRIRFEEEEEDEDLISKLPDCLLVEILSCLPSTEEAVRTGTLSKRWKHLWTSVSNLIFEHPFTLSDPNPDFYSFINKTLTQRPQSNLNEFQLHTYYNNNNNININNHQLDSRINNWIRYAVTCNVQHLHLTFWGVLGCALNPTGAIRWENLRSLCIWRLNITSKSVKNLVLYEYRHFVDLPYHSSDIIEINAPNILTLKLQACLALRKLLLLNMSSLVEADLDCMNISGLFEENYVEDEEEILKGFILNLLHVKDLKIGSSCGKVLARLKAKGFSFPSNLKVLDVTSSPNGSAGCDQENWMIFLCSTVL
ncbi:hypothetical protein M8C21_029600 [Ambrosia artemisiifolia]|uniref:F-box domain-containing protein n=1 Tax=Ambrosia artemisiifolia TaxID=4212 RepID=A0AAD5CR77_AMBAR|nr:hypothetical protein M8C21_029600 [Ambrosia artemisiifolia]